MKIDIWVVSTTSNQLFLTGSYTEKKKKKERKKVAAGKALILVIDPFTTPHSVCLNIDLLHSSFVWK